MQLIWPLRRKQSLRQCFNEYLENALQSAFGRVQQKTPLDDFTWAKSARISTIPKRRSENKLIWPIA